jgi:hypothetical protein
MEHTSPPQDNNYKKLLDYLATLKLPSEQHFEAYRVLSELLVSQYMQGYKDCDTHYTTTSGT